MALCDARLGDFDAAFTRLEALLRHRVQIGSRGLGVSLLHEARMFIELWPGDIDAAKGAFELARVEFTGPQGTGFLRQLDSLRRLLADAGPDVRPRVGSDLRPWYVDINLPAVARITPPTKSS